MRPGLNVVLISTYELGHQPFGLASPAAWLRQEGAVVTCLDLAVQRLDERAVAAADLVAFYVPMHTATRLAAALVERVRCLNPAAHLCFYGLYAPGNAAYLRTLGAGTILGGEFEEGLVALAQRLAGGAVPSTAPGQPEPLISLARQRFVAPDRAGLPALSRYAALVLPDGGRRTAGYTEATRGCKHLCRHCPIPPVYGGALRVVQQDAVLADIACQVEAGARHITFGDPDFFNGPAHGLRIVRELHRRFPALTYDVTIKVEHLLRHAAALPVLRETGCLFVTSAVESFDDRILVIFDKHHSGADVRRAAALLREVGLAFNPTFVAFTPWTSLDGYRALLATIDELDLVENVAPIQYGIRLLIPAGSLLLELPQVQEFLVEFDERGLCHRWAHPDPRVDALCTRILAAVQAGQGEGASRREIFEMVWRLAHDADGASYPSGRVLVAAGDHRSVAPIPHLSEPWYC